MRTICLATALALTALAASAETRAPLYASFLGGRHFERVQGVFIGLDGSLYVAGHTHSTDFPHISAGAWQRRKIGPAGSVMEADRADSFVMKLSSDGRQVIWATLIGGSRRDQIYAIRSDRAGNVYVLGATGSPDFPTTEGAWDRHFDGAVAVNALSDIFLAKFDPEGGLVFSTLLGGSGAGEENPRGTLWLDEARGLVYVAGLTSARDFPTTPDALQPAYGGGISDAFVAALSMDGKRLVHATYLGGSGADEAFTAIAPGPGGTIYVGGATSSADFPVTPGAFQTQPRLTAPGGPWQKDADAFVVRLSADLDRLVFSTLLGGAGMDEVSHNQGLTVDDAGRPVVVGYTASADFPVTPGAFQTRPAGPRSGFVAVLSQDGSRLVAASYLGGSEGAYLSGVAVDRLGRVHFGGETRSPDLPVTPGGVRLPAGLRGFYGVLSPDLARLEYLTYLGGSGLHEISWVGDRVRSLWIGPGGRVLIGGMTVSADLPVTPDALQPRFGGDMDGFVVLYGPLE